MDSTTQNLFEDGPPIPEMREMIFEEEQLASFLSDLKEFTKIESIQIKGGETLYADEPQLKLDDAFTALKTGSVRGVQIRYNHNGFDWTDTVFNTANDYKIIRCQHPISKR
ncbi:MAG: hypothetical protein KDA65_01570 [Planctomycetaceae bacterium]|jgi:hypothetical protein|nr:hypothetical protein [Planctomycetaceae bacterium]MCA9039015.1 hypothetical protein [Planctomycetaceae bacterium]|tara:strand:+ start:13937 stop:14269 length:333 start_codon:yes stop_codon:yes gene_type:complete